METGEFLNRNKFSPSRPPSAGGASGLPKTTRTDSKLWEADERNFEGQQNKYTGGGGSQNEEERKKGVDAARQSSLRYVAGSVSRSPSAASFTSQPAALGKILNNFLNVRNGGYYLFRTQPFFVVGKFLASCFRSVAFCLSAVAAERSSHSVSSARLLFWPLSESRYRRFTVCTVFRS
jgi:hypothetical protein